MLWENLGQVIENFGKTRKIFKNFGKTGEKPGKLVQNLGKTSKNVMSV